MLKRIPKTAHSRTEFTKRAETFLNYYRFYGLWDAYVQTRGYLEVFSYLSELYQIRKHRNKVLDFADLEYKLFEVLYFSENWSNILASFDEQTDHILVDEFQDTNGLQWAIVSKLVEEWRSGMGAKAELGKVPTLFLVGDEKQSIYLFRGANVEVFRRAKREMKNWMGKAFDEIKVKDNYRSLPNIVEFINALFSKVMKGGSKDWQTAYNAFYPIRNPDDNPGHVEILLTRMDEKKSMTEKRQAEAETVAARIAGIFGVLTVYDKQEKCEVARKCTYEDITLLLRRRTHLAKYEEALKRYNIPFVVIQGTGFHSAREVILLRQLLRVLANPRDTLALYGVLRSPLCGFCEEEILEIAFAQDGDDFWERYTFSALSGTDKAGWIKEASLDVDSVPSAILFERILRKRMLWSYFSDTQQTENIRKFIRILERFDREGLSSYQIAERLERMSSRETEPKATVNTEGMNAVKLMTIHAAKGLDSRIVFILGTDEEAGGRPEPLALREEGKKVLLSFTDSRYLEHPERTLWKYKLEEEQKRVFYVACTRARDALFCSGVWNLKPTGWLASLADTFKISEVAGDIQISQAPDGTVLNVREPSKETPRLIEAIIAKPDMPALLLERKWSRKKRRIRSVTEEMEILERDYRKSDRLIKFGEIMHKVLELISNSQTFLDEDFISDTVRNLIVSNELVPSSASSYVERIMQQLNGLKDSGLLEEYILHRDNAFSEVSFRLSEKGKVITGRIDRVLIDKDVVRIIDYKTFPSTGVEVGKYTEQLAYYAKACQGLFSREMVRTCLLFTADAKLVELR